MINLSVCRNGIGTLGNDKLAQCDERRKEHHCGLQVGLPEEATPGSYCPRLRAQWMVAGDKVLTFDDILVWEGFGNGALIYAFFCPRQPGVTRDVPPHPGMQR